MPTPIIICDDSSFARKQMVRALPGDWDVEITFASNGREGLEAVRSGRGELLFLDLTMPEMDGFEVLEAIRSEDLPVMTLVVSGDVQPEARARVRKLGALDFIRKPIDTAMLIEVLNAYGLLAEVTGTGREIDGRVDMVDFCQEIANVSMGRAAELLSRLLGVFVGLSVPQVSRMSRSELEMVLTGSTGDDVQALVCQGFVGGSIAGEALLVAANPDYAALARLLRCADPDTPGGRTELVMDLANVLIGAFLKGIAEQLDVHFSQGHPAVMRREEGRLDLIHDAGLLPDDVLAIELGYQVQELGISCDQLVLFTSDSFPQLQQIAEYALEG